MQIALGDNFVAVSLSKDEGVYIISERAYEGARRKWRDNFVLRIAYKDNMEGVVRKLDLEEERAMGPKQIKQVSEPGDASAKRQRLSR